MMRWRAALYAGLIVLAIVLGTIAAGFPSTHKDPPLGGNVTTTTSAEAPSGAAASVTTTSVPDTTTTTTVGSAHAVGDVTVVAVNASAVNGAATNLAKVLTTAGYKATASTTTVKKATATAIYFSPGYEPDAAAIARLLSAPTTAVVALPDPAPVKGLASSNVLVVLGSDLASTIH